MLRRCCPWWCAVSASSSAVAGVHKIVVPIEDFPPGWQPLTPQLAARAELGVGYHDDPRLRDENVPSYVRAAAAEVISHAPSSSDSSLPMDTLQAVASAQGVPSEEVEAAKGFAFKCFSMGDFGGTYRWMGHVAGLAREYDVEPILDSFFTEVSVTLPLTEPGRKLAQYMNQQEIRQAPRRNTSNGVVAEEEADDMMLSDDVKERVEARALHSFCWILNNDRVSRDNFNQEIFLQWHHRADYLVKRKAREKKEFRDNLTLEELLKSASQNRRRRVAQVEERDRLRKEAQKIPSPPNFRAHAKRAFAVANRSARAEVIRKSLAVPDGAQTTNAFVKGGKANPPDVVPRFPSAPDVGSARDVADLYDENESNDMDEDDAAVDHSTDDDGSIKSVIEANRRSKETGEPRKKVRSSIDVVLDVLPRELREAMDGGDQPDGMDDVRLGGGNAPRFQGRFKI